ncbi:MAG: ABC transporter permease [bacterium]|nr:ABC transporter permease [bacterium]
MTTTLKSEFRKLLSVRSTYFATALIIALTALFTYFGTSRVYEEVQVTEAEMSAQQELPPEEVPTDMSQEQKFIEPKLTNQLPKNTILNHLQNAIGLIGFISAIVAILLMAHEFRYNMITYTLTASNNRSKVLVSKILVVLAYSLVVSLIGIGTVVVTTYVAVGIKDLILPAQDYNWPYVIGRLLSYSVGFSLLGLALITLLRNITAGIVVLFVLPIVESIVGAILQGNNIQALKYLPVAALTQVSSVGLLGESIQNFEGDTRPIISVTRGLVTFGVALIVVWAVSWYLFLRRDAN